MMETISITELSPAELPPADKAIRAVVTLFWPFSSSTKQCALLLADPDFRLRKCKGQVRVRFTNGSAEAVARGKVGIGDQVLLQLGGATWAGEAGNFNTPGRSVDGELVFRGELELTLVKKAGGEVVNTNITVNENTPPPEHSHQDQLPQQQIIRVRDATATPARATPSYLRSSLGNADVVPIYSSPAFVRRLRLSEEKQDSSWDPFAEIEEEFEQRPRKKQRISFGDVGRWKVAERTPSPEEEELPPVGEIKDIAMEIVEKLAERPALDAAGSADTNQAAQSRMDTPSKPQTAGVAPSMPPPLLPKLLMPDDPQLMDSMTSESDGPSTPKLQPVPSSALPLPSPFPVESSQPQFGSRDRDSFNLASAQRAATTVDRVSNFRRDKTARAPAVPKGDKGTHVSHSLERERSEMAHKVSAASITDQAGDDVSLPSSSERLQQPYRDHHYSSQLPASQIEDLSDTEEDEEMYINHMRRRFPTFDERGYRRVDHQEEGYYDDLSEAESREQGDEDSTHTPLEPAERPDSGEEGGDEDEADDGEVEVIEVKQPSFRKDQIETPQHDEKQLEVVKTFASEELDPAASGLARAVEVKSAQHESRQAQQVSEQELENLRAQPRPRSQPQVHVLKTPIGKPPRVFDLHDAADTSALNDSTPQSDHDKIMKRTYSSLFGFKASPSPERKTPKAPQFQATKLIPPFTLPAAERSQPDNLSTVSAQHAFPVGIVPGIDMRVKGTHAAETPSEAAQLTESERSGANEKVADGVQDVVIQDRPFMMTSKGLETTAETASSNKQADLQWQAAETTAETSDSLQVVDFEDMGDDTSSLGDGVERPAETLSGAEPDSDDDGVITAALRTVRKELLTENSETRDMLSRTDDETRAKYELASLAHSSLVEDTTSPDNTTTPIYDNTQAGSMPNTSVSTHALPAYETEDPAPDGMALNKELGEAIAPVSEQVHSSIVSSPNSITKPSERMEIIHLRSSDNEDEQDTAAASPLAAKEPTPPTESKTDEDIDDGPSPQMSQMTPAQPRRARSRSIADMQRPSESTTQESQRSAPDLLDTTQTTLDRSEVETPIAQDPDNMVPNSLEEDGLWTQPSHQGFFAEQLHATELPGTQLPLTQDTTGTIGDVYNYLSFQSATSVATDNSDNPDAHLPAAAMQSFAGEDNPESSRAGDVTYKESTLQDTAESAIEILSSPVADVQVERMDTGRPSQHHVEISDDVQSQVTVIRQSLYGEQIPLDVDISSGGPVASSPAESEQRQPDFSFHSEQDQSEVSRVVETSQLKAPESVDDVNMEDVWTEAAPSYVNDPQNVALPVSFDSELQELPDADTVQEPSYSLLPISPEESQSQHEVDSMPFETQISRTMLPPTPQLTQGDSLIQPEAAVEDADEKEQPARIDSATPRRTRQTQVPVEMKKPHVRSSPRKPQANIQTSLEHTETSQDAHAAKDTPARGTRSKSSAANDATPEKRVSARRSSRRSQMGLQNNADTTQTSQSTDDVSQQPTTPEHVQEAVFRENLLSQTKKTPVRRSLRNSQAEVFMLDESGDAITVNSTSDKKTARVSSSEAQASAEAEAEISHGDIDMEVEMAARPSPKKTPAAKKSITGRLGNVPEAISNWFSPRRSTRQAPQQSKDTAAEGQTVIKRSPSNGFATKLAYYTPLSNLEQKLNPSSQSIENAIEVLAVVTDHTSPPERAKGGPRHYFTVFHITDSSLADENDSVRVEVYRPWHAKLPTAEVGDIVLLRLFAVKSQKRQPYLLSTDSSAWCVWRYAGEAKQTSSQTLPKGKGRAKQAEAEKPIWAQGTRQRNTSASGVREEIKGPPVELSDEERERAAELRVWWVDSVNSGTRAPAANIAAKTRSGTL